MEEHFDCLEEYHGYLDAYVEMVHGDFEATLQWIHIVGVFGELVKE
jgi:hypothetical protein